MFYRTLIVLGAAAMIGCSGEIAGRQNEGPTEEARLAAEAASLHYPANARANNDWRVAALVDRRANSIRIINFQDRPVRDVNIWVNQAFVRHVSSIPSNGYVVLPRDSFYDASGNTLANVNTSVTQVQIQPAGNRDNNALYNLEGPVMID